MARPLRDTDPSKVHLITVRTQESALWMIPGGGLNALLGGIIARYQEIFSVTLYAYTFTGNHYHMLVKAPCGHLDEFVENVNREIARRVNWRNRRRAKFWGRRYDDQVVLSEEDALEAFLYIVTNATKHGLISHPNQYPGLSCYSQLLDGKEQRFEFTHHTLSTPNELVKTSHSLMLSPLPQFEGLSLKERKRRLLPLINERVLVLQQARDKVGGRFMTAEKLRKQKAGTIPRETARSPRPQGYSKDPDLIREYNAEVSHIRVRYTEASRRYRLGESEVKFPPFTFKPPIHRAPRAIPFGHLLKQAA